MEKNRSSKVVAVVALVVAVFGLTLGFAAFSNTLVISSSATVKPDETAFNVVFSKTGSGEPDFTSKITATSSDQVATGDDATIAQDDKGNYRKITGIKANFTAPGQTITYTFYTHNAGSYIAYLKSISFANAAGGSSPKVCTAGSGATQGLVDAACNDITINVAVGTESTGESKTVSGHSLGIGAYEAVVVTIDYAKAEGTSGNPVDGEMSVAFGDITFGYSSVDA